jgi:hypothetical protein
VFGICCANGPVNTMITAKRRKIIGANRSATLQARSRLTATSSHDLCAFKVDDLDVRFYNLLENSAFRRYSPIQLDFS